jgi:hypothetical protein
MKKLLTIFCLLFSTVCFSQTTPIIPTIIPNAQPDFFYTPGRGPEEWNFQNQVNVPVQGTATIPPQIYVRYTWYQLQSSNAGSAGASMTFAQLDNDFQNAITAGQTVRMGFLLNFGISSPTVPPTVSGSRVVFPLALLSLMPNAHNDGSFWDEDVNDPDWLTWFTAFANNTANHINTTSFNGVPYSSVLKAVDLRICGAFGEGAVNQGEPFGTSTALNAMVDAYKAAFPNIPLEAMIGNFSGGIPGPTGIGITPLATSTYILSTSNTWGKFGVRRDNWGNNSPYIRNWTDLNPTVDGFRYDTTIQNRWKVAPVTGEPENSGTDMSDLLAEVTRAPFPTRIGNGNYGTSSTTLNNNMRAAYLAMGYRYNITGGNMTTTLTAGSNFNITLSWQNVGLTPSYDNWKAQYELRNAAGVVFGTWTSAINLRTFLPSGTPTTFNENFALTPIPAGTYNLFLIVRDAQGYMQPLPLAITGRQADGAYPLRSGINVVTTTNPVANAGNPQTIVLPTNSTGLSGSASTGTITSYNWTQVSGPNTAGITTPTTVTTTVTGLIQGTYVFQLSLNGGVSTATVSVTVNPAPPVANAGPNQTITLPTSTVNLSGSGSSGVITSFNWSRISGPNSPTITTPTTVNTSVTGLIAGTYVFQLSLNGGVSTSNVTITVNPAPPNPIANAGPNQTVILAIPAVTLNGSASTGTITSVAWTQVSGPNTAAIANPAILTTTVSGYIVGTYVFQLSLNGGVSTSTMTLVVNPTPPPVANAGSNQTITLPTAIVTLNGSGSTGVITSYAWSQVSGPNTATLASPTAVSTTASGLIAGTYVFRLTLNGGSSTSNVTITVNPAPAPATHVFSVQVPPTTTANDGTALEMGMKFQSSVSGWITGVRFYKAAGNLGTHIGELYSSTGTRLAQVTFTGETASGWQDMSFSRAVQISANTTYVVAYFSSLGNYTFTNNFFTANVVNAPLTGLSSVPAGGNGVYTYSGTPVFPVSTFLSTNYWVDVDFSTVAPPNPPWRRHVRTSTTVHINVQPIY